MKTKIRKTYNYLLQVAIIIIVYGFLYFELCVKRDFGELTNLFSNYLYQSDGLLLGVFACVLILLNLGIETLKWQFIIAKIERVSFSRAFQAVLTGISMSVFTPNRLGEFMGRIFFLKKANRIEGSVLTLLGSVSQLMATLFYGTLGLLFYAPFYFNLNTNYEIGMIMLGILLNALFLFLFLNIPYLSGVIKKLPARFQSRIDPYFESIRRFKGRELFKVFVFSSLRYFVFNFQFYLLLTLFGITMPLLHAFMISSVMYVVITIIPTIALSELGVRGSVSVFLFQQYSDKLGAGIPNIEMAVFAASAFLWLINIILPALVGTFFVFRLKFFRNNHE